jgi:hypothetical protein
MLAVGVVILCGAYLRERLRRRRAERLLAAALSKRDNALSICGIVQAWASRVRDDRDEKARVIEQLLEERSAYAVERRERLS